MMTGNLNTLLDDLKNHGKLILGVFSSPSKSLSNTTKATIRPAIVKQRMMYQVSEYEATQVRHRNIPFEELSQEIHHKIEEGFKQVTLFTEEKDIHILVSKKNKMTIMKKSPTKSMESTPTHNRKKLYLLQEGSPVPFLVRLGVMTAEGKVIAKMSDKFKQINRFVEMIADIVPHLDKTRTLHVVDFGCGKAYLTFALYHYLHHIAGFQVEVMGLDLKQDVIDKCRTLAKDLGYEALHFEMGDINDHTPKHPVDMVVALHACDTATDAALEKGVRWKADVILAVPCCQHELYGQVKSAPLRPLLKHGILKERFAALATDAARAQLLTVLGYHVQILEFIDMEHTPKNLLIRAIRQPHNKGGKEALKDYRELAKTLQITPSLEKRFQEELCFISS